MERTTPEQGGPINTGIRIDSSLWERFDRVVRAEHRSRNATIAMLVSRYVAEHEAA